MRRKTTLAAVIALLVFAGTAKAQIVREAGVTSVPATAALRPSGLATAVEKELSQQPSALFQFNFRVVDEATSPSRAVSPGGLVASSTTANPNSQVEQSTSDNPADNKSDPKAAESTGAAERKKESAAPVVLEAPGDAATHTADPLKLADVIASVYRSFPLIEQARLERLRAAGQLLEANGAYDTKLQGYSLAEPIGFYHNYRNGIGVARQIWWGGYLTAGYRIGRGDFQPWYKERETNEAGEFKLAFAAPLLQGRAIDAQRVAVFQASLAQQAAAPLVQLSILTAAREAAAIYWEWVAAGAMLEAQRELLVLAEERGEQFEVGFKAGKFAEIDLILNSQLIAERRGKVLETEQKFRATSFKLSIYLRDELGQPMVPTDDWLPHHFPVIQALPPSEFQADLADACARRPELMLLQIEKRHVLLDQQLARNQLLHNLDLVSEASQDMGTPASSTNDKGQFELLVGVQGEVPIQRNKARGKIQQTSAKMAAIDQKLRLQQNKIGVELQTAYNALTLSAQVVDQAEAALRAAVDTLSRYRFAFETGSAQIRGSKVDLIYINLLETKVNETEIKLVEAQRSWFAALAEMQASLGLDPLDQAMLISSLPDSGRAGPGNLPE